MSARSRSLEKPRRTCAALHTQAAQVQIDAAYGHGFHGAPILQVMYAVPFGHVVTLRQRASHILQSPPSNLSRHHCSLSLRG